jgi:hypothetical protein
MFNFNRPLSDTTEVDAGTEPVWKVLIYDQFGQDVISPLLKVGDLREHGITVHMYASDLCVAMTDARLLHTERQAIPDVPAIYFFEPTEDNIRRIAEVRRQ